MPLQPNTPAPDFKATNQDGNPITLNSFKGKKLVLFFYPKDLSGVCTKQACNMRDNYDALVNAGYEVVGISPDDEKSHQKFIAKHELNYSLLVDKDHKIAEAFDVWKEKSLYGHKYMGVARTTFIINSKGIIEHVIDKVKSSSHAAQILKTESKIQ